MKNWKETKDISAEKIRQKLKSRIQKHLSQGKDKLILLERRIVDEKRRPKLKADFEQAKITLAKLKDRFKRYEEKAVQYVETNPKKALALATSAGILAGAFWTASRKK